MNQNSVWWIAQNILVGGGCSHESLTHVHLFAV